MKLIRLFIAASAIYFGYQWMQQHYPNYEGIVKINTNIIWGE